MSKTDHSGLDGHTLTTFAKVLDRWAAMNQFNGAKLALVGSELGYSLTQFVNTSCRIEDVTRK